MKLLWMCNVPTKRIELMKNTQQSTCVGGWLEGLSESLLADKDIELCYCYPEYKSQKLGHGKKDNFKYYAIPISYYQATVAMQEQCECGKIYRKILTDEKPDVIHFFGTEFLYTGYFIKIASEEGYKDRIVTSIQGLVSVYYDHYSAGLPDYIMRRKTLSEIKGKCSLIDNKKNYLHRGKYEQDALVASSNIIGRTTWDKACAYFIAPESRYYFCNENLRSVFYDGSQWEYEKCNKYQIAISQAGYPIKGLHKVIEAVALLCNEFPDIKVKVGGANIFGGNWIKGNSYGIYIRQLLKKYNLQDQFEFEGFLSAEKMKRLLLESNVFVCPSSIENSPNSLGEAMILGVPCVASDVGGISDMLTHNEEGFLYPFDDSYKMAFYIRKTFLEIKETKRRALRAKGHAAMTHNRKKNAETLIEIYHKICGDNTIIEKIEENKEC